MSLFLTVITVGGIFALLTIALNLQLGYAGLINFGIVAYFTAGAYAYVILTQPPPGETDTYKFGFELPAWIGVSGAVAAAVIFAAVTGWPCLRLRGEYLALTTFAFAEVFGSLVTNTTSVTNGTLGFFGIEQPLSNLFVPEAYPQVLAAMIALLVLSVWLLVRRLVRAPFGQALRAVRDDELAALQAGKNVRLLRLQAFLLGAAISGIAGAVYVWYTTVASPEMFSADITFTVFIALILGGIGSNLGPIFGACVLVGLQEALRALATNPAIAERTGAVQAAVEGLLLVLLLRLAPGGVAELVERLRRGKRSPHESAATAALRREGVS